MSFQEELDLYEKMHLQSNALRFKEIKVSFISSSTYSASSNPYPAVRTFKACIHLPSRNIYPTPYLVLFVLPSVREAGYDSCDSAGWGNLTSIYHDKELHQIVIDFTTATLHNVDILPAYTLAYFHTGNRWGKESCIQAEIKTQPLRMPAEQPSDCIPKGLWVTVSYNQGCWAGTLLLICSVTILHRSLIKFNGSVSKAKSTQHVVSISTQAEHVNTPEEALFPLYQKEVQPPQLIAAAYKGSKDDSQTAEKAKPNFYQKLHCSLLLDLES